VEIDFSMSKKMTYEEMDSFMTTQEPVQQAHAMQVVILDVQTMIQITICATVRTIKISFQAQLFNHVLQMRIMHHRCPERLLSTIFSTTAESRQPTEQHP